MFERSEIVDAAVIAVMDILAGLDRGDVIKHRDVVAVTGIEKDSSQWKSVIHRVRHELLDTRGIALIPVVEIGYKLATKDEQLIWLTRHKERKALRQLNMQVRNLSAIPSNDLSLHQRRIQAVNSESLIRQRRFVKREMRHQGEAVRFETLPQRKPPPDETPTTMMA